MGDHGRFTNERRLTDAEASLSAERAAAKAATEDRQAGSDRIAVLERQIAELEQQRSAAAAETGTVRGEQQQAVATIAALERKLAARKR